MDRQRPLRFAAAPKLGLNAGQHRWSTRCPPGPPVAVLSWAEAMSHAAKPQTNAAIARQLAAVAQQLRAKGENPFKVRAYSRAAETIASLGDSIAEQVHAGADLTRYPGIGKGIAAALREIVLSGSLGQLELLLTQAPREVAELNAFPRLDAKRVARAYRKLEISSVAELQEKLASGELGRVLGPRETQHFQNALNPDTSILLDDAEPLVHALQDFLETKAGATHVEPAGAYRRRVEVISELCFVIETRDWSRLVATMQRFGGGLELVKDDGATAVFRMTNGLGLRLQLTAPQKRGVTLVAMTGSDAHLQRLEKKTHFLAKWSKPSDPAPDEESAYRSLGLQWIPPELREGFDEVELAARDRLPVLVTVDDIRGELHAHTTASDGRHTIEEMAAAARERGDDYLGITDHSQSLKIAGGVSEEKLWDQIRRIDRLNEKGLGIRILKSSEVDILADGSLDYPDELLAELDYTVCSIHSKFRLTKTEQTERLLRAMDNPHFNILGHTTGRLLLKRPGYEVDLPRLIAHARAAKVMFEINASPDRLDLSAENARAVHAADIRIAVCTDAHHIRELDNLRCGIDVARRAGLQAKDVLNCLPLAQLLRAFRR